MSVTLIAGLGNPGREYAATRHNLGFTAVDALAAAEGLKWKSDSRFESLTARQRNIKRQRPPVKFVSEIVDKIRVFGFRKNEFNIKDKKK